MRRSIELGILIVSVLLALSIFVALAENQTTTTGNTTKSLNANNTTANETACNATMPMNKTNGNATINNTKSNASKPVNNPFAKAKGALPSVPD